MIKKLISPLFLLFCFIFLFANKTDAGTPIYVPQNGTNLPADLAIGDTLQLVTMERRTDLAWWSMVYKFDSTIFRANGHVITPEMIVNGPVYLIEKGATYTLTGDATSVGTAIVVAAKNITLDLNGHTVKFGTDNGMYRYGIAMPPGYQHVNPVWSGGDLTNWGNGNGVIIKNGKIEQIGHGSWCFAVGAYGLTGITLNNVSVLIRGDDTWGIHLEESRNVSVTYCTVVDSTNKVSNRHQGRAAIDVDGLTDGPVNIDHNIIRNARQWGIRVGRRNDMSITPQTGYIRWNQIDLNTIVTNGYGLGIHARNFEARGNTIEARNGRGIHIEGDNDLVINNIVSVRELPDTTEYTRVSAHGIKLEGCRNAEITQNTVLSYGQYPRWNCVGPASALNIADNGDCYIHDNVFEAIMLGGPAWTGGYGDFAACIEFMCIGPNTRIERNTFKSNDRMIQFIGYNNGSECNADTTSDGYAAAPSDAFNGNYWVRATNNTGVPEIAIQYSHFKGLEFRPAGMTNCTFTSWVLGWNWTPCEWSVYQKNGTPLKIIASE